MDKVMTLEEAAALVPDGATIAIGGLSMNSTPMAFVRQLCRRGVKDLTLVAIVNGMAVDWLVAAGCVRTVVTGLISFEGLGLAPAFRSAVERGEVAVEEYSEHLLICRLQAAARNLPFVPTQAGLGTDVLGLHPDTTRLEVDPVSGQSYVACTPLPVDFAVVHAHAADRQGNVRVEPKLVWMDSEIVNAAATTIATVERIVPTSTFKAEPHFTTYPRFMVGAVAEVPWGAYPTSLFPVYTHHRRFYQDYTRAASDQGAFETFFAKRVVGPPTHREFLEANGGAATLLEIRREDDVREDLMVSRRRLRRGRADGRHPCPAVRQPNQSLQRGGPRSSPVCAYLLARRNPRARAGVGGVLHCHRRRPAASGRVHPVRLHLGWRDHAFQLAFRFLDLRPGRSLQHLRLSRRPDRLLRQREQHRYRPILPDPRSGCRGEGAWQT
ncbi:MAG: hypothetical protein KatS3mg011_2386 [Acidimicrobiia bacterium]|nr:MAG: hypothetical protein KatS3mg011_2386 [Acidimicrobiia bacterium]